MAKKLIGAGTIILVTVLVVGSAWQLLTPRWVYQVSIAGDPVGTVASLDEYVQLLNDIQTRAEGQWGCDLVMNEEVTADRVRLWSPQLSPASVRAGIVAAATYETKGWAIIVNGDTVAIVNREQTAKDILEEMKAHYLSKEKNCTLVSASLQENVSLERIPVSPTLLSEKAAVLEKLIGGREESKAYVVKKGDTLAGISRANNVPLAALREANALSGDTLQVGQVLSLQSDKALLHVKTVEDILTTETISRPVKYKINPDKSVRGDTVTDWGADGRREVTRQVVKINGTEISRQIVGSQVTKEPAAKTILTGIGYWPARPTGIFRFPLNSGVITSVFGAPRAGGPHRGLDIGISRGTPVYTAASGTVTVKTRSNSYGRYIVIQHVDGYSTLYAHLSEFAPNLRVGGSVVRGQFIGRVGSSGYSTGPHLHWEVRRYGQALNPLNFFSGN